MKLKRIAASVLVALMLVSMFGVMLVFAPAPSPIPPSPVVSNVFVTNTSDNPVPVDITDPVDVVVTNSPGSQPFHAEQSFEIDPSSNPGGSIKFWDNPPEGKRVVIEYVSAEVSCESSEGEIYLIISTQVTELYQENIMLSDHYMGVFEPSGETYRFISKNVKIYCEHTPYNGFCAQIWRSAGGQKVYAHVTLSGYLIDAS